MNNVVAITIRPIRPTITRGRCIVVGYTMDTMYFSWQESPVEIDPGVQLPQFVLEGKILYDCSQNYTAGQQSALPTSSVLVLQACIEQTYRPMQAFITRHSCTGAY